ncbi:hypothetical protein [Iodobacter ciconiae]|uniref:Lipoprotein n=1 Tax=Iodobacter ciconiae TaxID=2496266 RepID=A0A3S8ZRC3_9NEIS|nr:hypothetical protein [Iodobacter ciconiae]AZN36017.1 hypothetical protein EJO50_05700 [Iodobacter ciconiae]
MLRLIFLLAIFTLTGCASTGPKETTNYSVPALIYHSIKEGTNAEKTPDYFSSYFGKPDHIYKLGTVTYYDWRERDCQVLIAFNSQTMLAQPLHHNKTVGAIFTKSPTDAYFTNCNFFVNGPKRAVLLGYRNAPAYQGKLSTRGNRLGDNWQYWVGKSPNDLIKSWGVPSRSMKVGSETILQYDDYSGYYANCQKKFFVSKGVITEFNYSGCSEPPQYTVFYPVDHPIPGKQ